MNVYGFFQDLTPQQKLFVFYYREDIPTTIMDMKRDGIILSPETGRAYLADKHVAQALEFLTHIDRPVTTEDRVLFWTRLMTDPRADMKDRLRASETLSKIQGDFASEKERDEERLNLKNLLDASEERERRKIKRAPTGKRRGRKKVSSEA